MALKGLFTAHVTGNFVTLGSSLVFGTAGALAKTLALPMFCAVVLASRLLALRLEASGRTVFRNLLRLQVLLLIVVAGLAVWLGPFEDADQWPALVLGMTLVAAMAMQNASHRTHLAHAPPSTIMTGSTTQIMLDLAEIVHGPAVSGNGQMVLLRAAGSWNHSAADAHGDRSRGRLIAGPITRVRARRGQIKVNARSIARPQPLARFIAADPGLAAHSAPIEQ